jgi:hypothetical protein
VRAIRHLEGARGGWQNVKIIQIDFLFHRAVTPMGDSSVVVVAWTLEVWCGLWIVGCGLGSRAHRVGYSYTAGSGHG